MDVSAKANHLKEPESVIKYVKTFESAQHDQTRWQSNAKIIIVQSSNYQ